MPDLRATNAEVLRALRSLYVVRTAFSVAWVLAFLSLASEFTMGDHPDVWLALLLVVYPTWDAIAMLVDVRLTGADSPATVQVINAIVSTLAAGAMVVALFTSVGTGVLVFGIWAIAAGALTLVVAVRRLRSLGAQWPMMISGGLALFVGTDLVVSSMQSGASPTGLASYVGFGALWFALTAVAVSVRARRTTGARAGR